MKLVSWIAFGFIGLALLQGIFTFVGGRLAAQTGRRNCATDAELFVRSSPAAHI